jgi:hypothetical protein
MCVGRMTVESSILCGEIKNANISFSTPVLYSSCRKGEWPASGGTLRRNPSWHCGGAALASVRTRRSLLSLFRRRNLMYLVLGYTLFNGPVLHMDIDGMIKLFGFASITHLTGNLVSNLLKALNAKEPGANVFTHRPTLRLLIHDILKRPPEEAASADEETSSDSTGQSAGVSALQGKTRDVVHGNPAEQNFSAALHIQGSPALQQATIQETGSLPLSKTTPKAPRNDPIVASFLAGDYELLRATYEPEVLISALSSSLAVILLLLTIDDSAKLNTNVSHLNSHSTEDFSQAGAQHAHPEVVGEPGV